MKIRPVCSSDTQAILDIYAPFVENTAISFEEVAPSFAEMAMRIENYSKIYPWLVVENQDGDVIAYSYACEYRTRPAYRWSVELSVYINPQYNRKGAGRMLYNELLKILKENGFYNAYAVITLPNLPSVQFHESMGFKKIGVFEKVGYKFGRWHDVGWWGFTIQEHSNVPLR